MNVKTGDLAILIRDPISSNIGIICEVGKFFGSGLSPYGEMMSCVWDVRSVGRKFEFADGGKPSMEAYVEDECLRPISGLPDAIDANTEESISAGADEAKVIAA